MQDNEQWQIRAAGRCALAAVLMWLGSCSDARSAAESGPGAVQDHATGGTRANAGGGAARGQASTSGAGVFDTAASGGSAARDLAAAGGTAGIGSKDSGGAGGGTQAPEDAPATPLTPTHGWSEVRGAELGSHVTDNTQLRKSLTVHATGDDRLEVIAAHAVRDTLDSSDTWIVMELVNRSPSFLCFISAQDVQYADATGAALPSPKVWLYLGGSLGIVSGRVNDTCLATGEHGYITEPENKNDADFYDKLTSIAFTLAAEPYDLVRPPFALVPEAYNVERGELQVTLRNHGRGAARIDLESTAQYLLVDEAGAPLSAGFLDFAMRSAGGAVEKTFGTLSVGSGETILGIATLAYDGRANAVRVLSSP